MAKINVCLSVSLSNIDLPFNCPHILFLSQLFILCCKNHVKIVNRCHCCLGVEASSQKRRVSIKIGENMRGTYHSCQWYSIFPLAVKTTLVLRAKVSINLHHHQHRTNMKQSTHCVLNTLVPFKTYLLNQGPHPTTYHDLKWQVKC